MRLNTFFVKVGTTRSDVPAFVYPHEEAGAVRINQWGEARIKIPTQAV